jgi:cullin-4
MHVACAKQVLVLRSQSFDKLLRLPCFLQAVEDMCRHQMQDRLYKKLQAECDAHIAQQLSGLQAQTELAPAAFLEQVAAMWENYCSQMLLIRSIFLYLDRTYVISLPGLRSLFDTGLASLRQHLTEHPKVWEQCADACRCFVSVPECVGLQQCSRYST